MSNGFSGLNEAPDGDPNITLAFQRMSMGCVDRLGGYDAQFRSYYKFNWF